jgi:single-strand DNA-binding protein
MVNRVQLIGRLGKDPELRTTPNGTSIATFSLATDEKKGKQKHTEWHRIVTWQKLAEICDQYLEKGSLVYVEGRIQTRQWNDRDGNKRTTTEIVASGMKMLDRSETTRQRERNNDSNMDPEITDDDLPF